MRRILAGIAYWAVVVLGTLSIVAVLVPQTASAVNFFGDVCTGDTSDSAVCSASSKDNISGNDGIILKVANLIAIISGIAAVIMIIIGGFMFITSGGDSSHVSSAKKTIVYAVVGLVVVVLARTIVGFIVTRV